jgi:hypothetical protein
VISLDSALATARQTVTTVTRRATERGYYSGARTEIINSHAELRAALDMLIRAAEQTEPPVPAGAARTSELPTPREGFTGSRR